MEAKKIVEGEFCTACITQFSVTTTGLGGGDAGHGGYATLSIYTECASAEISQGEKVLDFHDGRIHITFSGDEEMRQFAVVLAKAGINLAAALGMTVAEVLGNGEDPNA